MEPLELRTSLRAKARRAAQAVTLSLTLGGCYVAHDVTPPPIRELPPMADGAVAMLDGGPPDARPPVVDGGPMWSDAGLDSGAPCVPDVDCASGGGDGFCDWEQHNACCDALMWEHPDCWLLGGPMTPPEMHV